MPTTETRFEEVKRYVALTADDAALLRSFRNHSAPRFECIAQEFYNRIRQHEAARLKPVIPPRGGSPSRCTVERLSSSFFTHRSRTKHLISRPIDRRGFWRFAAISFAAISGRIARLMPRSSRAVSGQIMRVLLGHDRGGV